MKINLMKRILIIFSVLLLALLPTAAAFAEGGDGSGGDNADKPLTLDFSKSNIQDNATGIPKDYKIALYFTKNVVNIAVGAGNKNCFSMVDTMTGETVAINVDMGDDRVNPTDEVKNTVYITPKEPYKAGHIYKLTVSNGVQAKSGAMIDKAYEIRFTVKEDSATITVPVALITTKPVATKAGVTGASTTGSSSGGRAVVTTASPATAAPATAKPAATRKSYRNETVTVEEYSRRTTTKKNTKTTTEESTAEEEEDYDYEDYTVLRTPSPDIPSTPPLPIFDDDTEFYYSEEETSEESEAEDSIIIDEPVTTEPDGLTEALVYGVSDEVTAKARRKGALVVGITAAVCLSLAAAVFFVIRKKKGF